MTILRYAARTVWTAQRISQYMPPCKAGPNWSAVICRETLRVKKDTPKASSLHPTPFSALLSDP